MEVIRETQQIKLADGRMLGYDEHGDPQGKPVIFMHGFPGSRFDWPLFDPDDSAMDLKARLIAVDRPGMGLSDFKKRREILDWPDDVSELADKLQLDQFAVLAISGGGPYGEACAFKIPGGVQHEAGLYKRPWGFRLQDIGGEVHLWHGGNDNNVSTSVGHYVAEAIPNCEATFIEDEGHFSLPYHHMREILTVLVE